MPKLLEKYEARQLEVEKDLPTMELVVKSEWKKEGELKELKAELKGVEEEIKKSLGEDEDVGVIEQEVPVKGVSVGGGMKV